MNTVNWFVQTRQLCVIKLIDMTHTQHNIAGLDGSVLVPVLSETGSLMAYLLSANPQGILEEFYPAKAMVRQYVGNTQAIPPQQNMNTPNPTCTGQQVGYYLFNQHKETLRNAAWLFTQ
jgi:hypothetical protein